MKPVVNPHSLFGEITDRLAFPRIVVAADQNGDTNFILDPKRKLLPKGQ